MGSFNRRGYFDIVAEILKAAASGKTKTRIMYTAGLSYSQTDKYLSSLIRKGLVKNTGVRRNRRLIKTYRTTERGVELLDRLESLEKLLLE